MAFAPAFLRTNTAPVFPASSSSHSSASTMSQMRASHLSGSTAYTSASSASLSSLGGATLNGGQVVANANIINQKADASRSLYQICVSLRLRLSLVPGFKETYLQNYDPITDDDPVEFIWTLLRTGHPLVHTYNSLGLGKTLEIPTTGADSKRSKIAVFKFAEACLNVLKIPECFVINDLLGNDTTGFVKVTNVVNSVLDLGEQNGILQSMQPDQEDLGAAPTGSQVTIRDHILKELVNTERKYVQDLENLHDLKKTLEQRGVIPGDIVHQIFLNINAILDFQRRFLIRVETTNSVPNASQRWGAPFVQYEETFDIYHPFIANQRKAAQTANQVMDKIRLADHPVSCDFNTLDGFLLKPMQRLVKYPLLLKELLKRGSSDDPEVKQDLQQGIEAAERVLMKANAAVDRDLLDEALEELITRVEDWKNHRVEQFGRLLQHGVHTVVTGRSDQEKEYEIYLFENILLCCKEIIPNKDKSKKDKTKSAIPRPRNKNNKLQLKGRIFMTNVTDIISFAKPGSYTVQIWWKGDPGVENFIVKFNNEEMMKKWSLGLETQRKENAPSTAVTPDATNPEFAWMRNVNNIENPYAQQDDDDEDEDPNAPQFVAPNFGSTGGVMQRNSSSNNLRMRSITGASEQSLAGIARAPPPRFPLPVAPNGLTLQTAGGANSPGPRGGDSYFSPTAESPASSRTSTASNMFAGQYPFPRTSTPGTGWEDNNRYTAPAAPRASSRDGSSPANGYGRNSRGSQSQQSMAQQQRSRSYSTPDINQQPGRRTNSSTPVPAVPGIPSHLHPAHDSNIPRSNTGSPRQDIPIRSNTQSPGLQRDRLNSTAGHGGAMGQFPSQPVHRSQGSASLQPISIQNHQAVSPSLGSATPGGLLSNPDLPIPTQLKVKVNCDSGNYVTLVVAFNITYQSLIDRIDAKLARFTNSSIGRGGLRLKYSDEDGDFVTIESDDDIQIAFLEWREGVRNMYAGGVGEIELFCVGDMK